jgi:hypothetical protein
MKAHKEVMMTWFWGGIGFWTASKVVLEAYRFMKDLGDF